MRESIELLDCSEQFVDIEQSAKLGHCSEEHLQTLCEDEREFLKEHLACVYEELIGSTLINMKLKAKLEQRVSCLVCVLCC